MYLLPSDFRDLAQPEDREELLRQLASLLAGDDDGFLVEAAKLSIDVPIGFLSNELAKHLIEAGLLGPYNFFSAMCGLQTAHEALEAGELHGATPPQITATIAAAIVAAMCISVNFEHKTIAESGKSETVTHFEIKADASAKVTEIIEAVAKLEPLLELVDRRLYSLKKSSAKYTEFHDEELNSTETQSAQINKIPE